MTRIRKLLQHLKIKHKLDEKDKVIYNKRLPNNLAKILSELSPYQAQIKAIAIESTFSNTCFYK